MASNPFLDYARETKLDYGRVATYAALHRQVVLHLPLSITHWTHDAVDNLPIAARNDIRFLVRLEIDRRRAVLANA